jgi:hypothetical protein
MFGAIERTAADIGGDDLGQHALGLPRRAAHGARNRVHRTGAQRDDVGQRVRAVDADER